MTFTVHRCALGLVVATGGLVLGCCNVAGQTHPEPGETASPTAAQRAMLPVPPGRYPIGRDSGPASQRPRHVVSLTGFRIDRTEVTNAAFADYLNALRLPVRGSFGAGGISERNGDAQTVELLTTRRAGASHKPLIELDDGDARIMLLNGRFAPVRGKEDHPVTEVTWAGARAYCIWRGGDLPTEVQWEAAARGTDDRLYPWGDAQPDNARMVSGGRIGETRPVGSKPQGASPHGLLDAAGSLAEWTRSLKRPYPYRADDGREDSAAPGERTTRGGDYEYADQAINFTVSFRDGFSNDPVHGHRHVGFRCTAPNAG